MSSFVKSAKRKGVITLSQKYDMETVVSGSLMVTIEGIGTLGAEYNRMSLFGFAGNAYVILSGKRILANKDTFELIDFNVKKGELKVRLAN